MLAAGIAAIFMYHHVAAQPARGPYGAALTIAPHEFASQLAELRRMGCATVTVDEIVKDVRRGLRGCEAALTFDDGYADAASAAVPLLRSFGDVATFFISTGYVNTPGHMSSKQVAALATLGMEIGAHTITHTDLTLLRASAAEREIAGSRAALQAVTGMPVRAFAYPAGRYDAALEDQVKAAGFDIALSTNPGILDAAAVARDTYALPRYRILRAQGEALMRDVLRGGGAAARSDARRRTGAPLTGAALHHIAKSRIEGNDAAVAERVAVALLSGNFPEPIIKVRVLKTAPAAVAGIMLSGVKFHERVDRRSFAADVSDMIQRSLAADPAVSEVDVWAVVPVAVEPGAPVSGDFAVPANRTVFSASVTRSEWLRGGGRLGRTYWEKDWLQDGA